MLKKLAHKIVAIPAVYEAVQVAAGWHQIRPRLQAIVDALPSVESVLDCGGGTGMNRVLFEKAARYVCIDLDPVKLLGFRARHPRDLALLADATRLPFGDGAFDLVFSASLGHHLSDEQLEACAREAMRLLKPEGRLIHFEPVWKPKRLPGRLLWHFDRGANPRSAEQLSDLYSRVGHVERWEQFSYLHAYVAGVVRRRP
jgi:SAM-dependent methyltransferase